ncbi:MAG: hypothetical protein IKW00_02225 [Clostridia bacterium]|nr:hypothetical protein [Clostridia bacterium]
MKKRILCLFLCLNCLLLTGCSDGLSRSLMVITMGIDVNEKGYTVTIKAPNYGASGQSGDFSSQSDHKSEEENYLNLSVTGTGWEHALSLLNAATPRIMRFGQLREIVISLDTALSGHLNEILTQVDILQNVRTHAKVIICRGTAKDFLKSQKSAVGKRLSTYLDVTLDSLREKGYIPTATLSTLLRDLNAPWRDPLIACAAFAEENEKGSDTGGENRPVDQLAGTLPVSGSSMGEYIGALAVGQQGNYVLLTGYEVQLYHLITGEIQSMAFGAEGQYFDVLPRGKSRLSLKNENGQEALLLHLPVTVEYSAFREAPGMDLSSHLEKEITHLIQKLQSASCDALGYGGLAARQYKTLFDFVQSPWQARYRSAAVQVSVSVLLRQQGRT